MVLIKLKKRLLKVGDNETLIHHGGRARLYGPDRVVSGGLGQTSGPGREREVRAVRPLARMTLG